MLTPHTRDIENSLTFLRVTESNIDELAAGLSDLYHAVRGWKYDPAYWRWCYFCNPVGKSNTVVAVRAGRVVGELSKVYLPLVVQGERVTASLTADFSVHPSEHSWQCLRGVLEMSVAESQKDKVAFGFGFSNRLAAAIHRLLGGMNLGRAPIHLGFLNAVSILEGRSVPYPLSLIGWLAQPVVRLKIRSAGSSDLDIRWVENFDNSFNELWSVIEKDRIIAVVKDAAYLNWRYVKCPVRRYGRLAAYRAEKLEGFVVFCAGAARHNAFILELLARDDNPETMRALLLPTFRDLRTQGTGYVWASFPADSRATTALKQLGFKSWGTRLWNIDMIIATDPRKKSCPELDLKSWDFSLGDWLCF